MRHGRYNYGRQYFRMKLLILTRTAEHALCHLDYMENESNVHDGTGRRYSRNEAPFCQSEPYQRIGPRPMRRTDLVASAIAMINSPRSEILAGKWLGSGQLFARDEGLKEVVSSTHPNASFHIHFRLIMRSFLRRTPYLS